MSNSIGSSSNVSKLELVPKRTLADEIAVRICEAIWNGFLPPEERLPEGMLAETFKVSRGPVRDALSKLERQGLVVKNPNRSAVVACFSREDLYEVYTLRVPLEQLAARTALSKTGHHPFDEMQEAIDEMAAALEGGITEQKAADLDVRFHEILLESSKHRRLLECWSNLKPQIYILLLSRNVANADFREFTVTSHQQILNALRDKAEEKAVQLIEDHIYGSYERIAEVWGEAR